MLSRQVTFKPGKPEQICKTRCGKPCLLFCDHPCLLDCPCPDGGSDFADPSNPDPPHQPKPTPPTEPLPWAPTVTSKPRIPKVRTMTKSVRSNSDCHCQHTVALLASQQQPFLSQSLHHLLYYPPTQTQATTVTTRGPESRARPQIRPLTTSVTRGEVQRCHASKPNSLRTLILHSYEYCIEFGDSYSVETTVSTVINGCRLTDPRPVMTVAGFCAKRSTSVIQLVLSTSKVEGTVSSDCTQWRIDPGVYWGQTPSPASADLALFLFLSPSRSLFSRLFSWSVYTSYSFNEII